MPTVPDPTLPTLPLTVPVTQADQTDTRPRLPPVERCPLVRSLDLIQGTYIPFLLVPTGAPEQPPKHLPWPHHQILVCAPRSIGQRGQHAAARSTQHTARSWSAFGLVPHWLPEPTSRSQVLFRALRLYLACPGWAGLGCPGLIQGVLERHLRAEVQPTLRPFAHPAPSHQKPPVGALGLFFFFRQPLTLSLSLTLTLLFPLS